MTLQLFHAFAIFKCPSEVKFWKLWWKLWWRNCLFTFLWNREGGKIQILFFKKGFRLPLYNSISGACYCYPLSIAGWFSETRRCFLRCLQVSSSSSLLFSIVCWFSVSIVSFSVKQRSQDLLPLENACPRAFIDHFTSKGISLSLSFQTYEDSVVWLAGLSLNDALCW